MQRETTAHSTQPFLRARLTGQWTMASLVFAAAIAACGGGDEPKAGGGSGSVSSGASYKNVPPPERHPIDVPSSFTAFDRLPAEPGDLAGCNVILISMDTTRADYLGCYGRSAAQTPNIDRLAHGGVLFERAVTPAPTTLPSHASMMTGLMPVHHGARTNGAYRLEDQHETLAEVFASKGYATGAVVSAYVLSKTFGLTQGFDHYDDEMGAGEGAHWVDHPERSADATTDRGIAWLQENRRGRFFLWMHYFDAHGPYEPPAPYAQRFRDSPYDGEIAFMDAQIGRLTGALAQMGLSQKTLIVLTADHGESLDQQYEASHGYLLYDTVLQVPLIFNCGDKLKQGVRVPGRVSLIDLAPTILSLIGIESEMASDGVNLLSAPDPDRAIFVETLYGRAVHGWAPLYGVYHKEQKFIQGPDPEFYQLGGDAFESKNVIAEQAAQVSVLGEMLADVFGDAARRDSTDGGARQMDAADAAALAELGYSSAEGTDIFIGDNRPDPKDMVRLLGRVEWLVDAEAHGVKPMAEVLAELERMAQQRPELSAPSWHLGDLHRQRKEYVQALAVLDRGLAAHPGEQRMLKMKGRVLLEAQRGKEAIAVYQQVLAAYPQATEALTGLAAAYVQSEQFDDVVDIYKRILPIFPGEQAKRVAFVQAAMKVNRLPEAVAVLDGLLGSVPENKDLRADLVGLFGQIGQYARSMNLLRDGILLNKDDLDQVRSLALALLQVPDPSLKNPAEAVLLLEQINNATNGQRPDYLMSLSSAYAATGDRGRALGTAETALAMARQAGATQLAPGIAAQIEKLRQ